MPLDKDRLKDGFKEDFEFMKNEYVSGNFLLSSEEIIDRFCDKLATRIYNEFTVNAEVTGSCPQDAGPLINGKIT